MIRDRVGHPRHKLILIAMLLLVASALAGCEYRPLEGAAFREELKQKEDGLVYKIGEDKPYTGKAYESFSPEMLPFAHWTGEFKDGKRHGIFVFPESRDPDGFFLPDSEHVVRVRFKDGIEVGIEK